MGRARDAVVISAGQAGLATSWRLTARGVDHVVLDADRIGATWLTRRWDSFRLVSPDHLNELPGGGPVGSDPVVLGVGADAIHVADTVADHLAGVPGAWPTT